jgi:hypothetical protein
MCKQNWAAYQAFLANPQHEPENMYFEIALEDVQYQHITINNYPIRFRFGRVTPLNAIPPDSPIHGNVPKGRIRDGSDDSRTGSENEDVDEDIGNGYWTLDTDEDADLNPIRIYSLPIDLMKKPTPQWPYILGKVLHAKHTNQMKIVQYLILQALENHGDVDGNLNQFMAPAVDESWSMNEDMFTNGCN